MHLFCDFLKSKITLVSKYTTPFLGSNVLIFKSVVPYIGSTLIGHTSAFLLKFGFMFSQASMQAFACFVIATAIVNCHRKCVYCIKYLKIYTKCYRA